MPRWTPLALSVLILYAAASVCIGDEMVVSRGATPGVDAVLDDACWQAMDWRDDFSILGKPGTRPGVGTRAKLSHDGTSVYLAVECDEPDPGAMKITSRNERDSASIWTDDCIQVFVDPTGAGRSFYQFMVNYKGTMYDARAEDDNTGRGAFAQSVAWDSHARVATRVLDDRWLLEMAIPIGPMMTDECGDEWLLNIGRSRYVDDGKTPEHHQTLAPISGAGFIAPSELLPARLDGFNAEAFGWRLVPGDVAVARTDAGLECRLTPILSNQTGEYAHGRLVGRLRSETGTETAAEAFFSLVAGHEEPIDLVLPVPEPGRNTLSLSVLRNISPDTPLAVATRQVELQYKPIEIVVRKPAYRNCIFATQYLREIELDVNVLDAEVAAGQQLLVVMAGEKGEVARQLIENPQAINPVRFPAGELPDGWYSVAAALAAPDARSSDMETAVSESIHKLPRIEGEVWLDENGVTHVDGEPFLPFGWFGGYVDDPPTCNTMQNYGHGFTEESLRSYLDSVHAAGKKAIIYPYQEFDGTWEWKHFTTQTMQQPTLSDAQKQVLEHVIERFGQHPALLAWYLCDEPEARDHSPQWYRELHEFMAEHDPYHPCIVLNYGLQGINTYYEGADILMPDCYPNYRVDAPPRKPTWCTTLWARTAASLRPMWLVPQAFPWHDDSDPDHVYRGPTFDELRNQVYQTIAADGKGIICYSRSHWSWACHELNMGVPSMGEELAALKDGLLAPTIPDGVSATTDPGIEHFYVARKQAGADTYIIAINAEDTDAETPSQVQATLTVTGLGDGTLYVAGEGRAVQAREGRLTDTFAPMAVHVYTTNRSQAEAVDVNSTRTRIDEANAARLKPGNLVAIGRRWLDEYRKFDEHPPANVTLTATSSVESYSTQNTAVRYLLLDGIIEKTDSRNSFWNSWQPRNTDTAPALTFEFPESETVGRVVLYTLLFGDEARDGNETTPRLADCSVEVDIEGEWRQVASVEGNTQHIIELQFEPVQTERVRVNIKRLNEAPYSTGVRVLSEVEMYAE